jgi:hypothetical protein
LHKHSGFLPIMTPAPEREARQQIDRMLAEAG